MSSFTRKTAGSNAAEQATHTTASITPGANTATFINFTTLRAGVAASDVPTVSGAGLTWSKVRGVLVESGLVMFTYVGTGSGSAGTLTITHAGGNSLGCSWIVDECSGCNTTTPVVQSVAGSGTGTALLATLAAFSNVNNATYGIGDATTDPITAAGSGFTSLGVNTGVFSNSMISQWKSTNDTTVDATAGGSTPWGMIGIEIAEPAGGSEVITVDHAQAAFQGQTIGMGVTMPAVMAQAAWEGSDIGLLTNESYVIPVLHAQGAFEGQQIPFVYSAPSEAPEAVWEGQEIPFILRTIFGFVNCAWEGQEIGLNIASGVVIPVVEAQMVGEQTIINLTVTGLAPPSSDPPWRPTEGAVWKPLYSKVM